MSLLYLTPTFNILKLKDTFIFFFHREEGSGVFLLRDFQLSLTQGHWSKRFGKSEINQTTAGFGV